MIALLDGCIDELEYLWWRHITTRVQALRYRRALKQHGNSHEALRQANPALFHQIFDDSNTFDD